MLKAYRSIVVYITKGSDVRQLLNKGFFYTRGESGYIGIFKYWIYLE